MPLLAWPDQPSRRQLAGELLRMLALAAALWAAIAQFDLRGPDLLRYVLSEPSEHELGPAGCAPFC